MSETPRKFWEERGFMFRLDKVIEEYEQDPHDESIGLFLHENVAKRIEELSNGIYAHDNPSISQGTYGIPPIPHDLAATYLRQCARALQRLADLEERRAAQGTGESGETPEE